MSGRADRHDRRRPVAAVAFGLVVGGTVTVLVTAATPAARAAGGDPRDADPRPPAAAVVASCTLPVTRLAAATDTDPAVMLGGLSDLCVERQSTSRWRAWAVTDRGPNGMVTVQGRPRRTLVAPSFAPRIVELAIDWDAAEPERVAVTVTGTTTLGDRDGQPLSGRPNGLDGDPAMVDPDGSRPIAPDPDGVDPEGLVRTRSGGWWLAEEYRPSLVAATADGAASCRLVPAGQSLEGAGMEVRDSLPEAYARRRDNRGFEALALAPDESRLFALVQSPLERRDGDAAHGTGVVRLLVLDPANGDVSAEHVYPLDDASNPGRRGRGKPADVKLCAMAAVGPAALIVLEQADGEARLVLADLARATDTLPRSRGGDEPALESLRDPEAAGIVPVAKTLLADLGPALAGMRSLAGLPGRKAEGLKIEGLAIADEWHLFLINDDDFGVREDAAAASARSCLWVLRLPRPLPGFSTLTAAP